MEFMKRGQLTDDIGLIAAHNVHGTTLRYEGFNTRYRH